LVRWARSLFSARRSKSAGRLFDMAWRGRLAGWWWPPAVVYGPGDSKVGPITPGGLLEGNSILYLAINTSCSGGFWPGNGMDEFSFNSSGLGGLGRAAHHVAVTCLLRGQLDGGTSCTRSSAKRALAGGRSRGWAAGGDGLFWSGWFLWAFPRLCLGVRASGSSQRLTPMGLRRTLVGIGVLVLFVLTSRPDSRSARFLKHQGRVTWYGEQRVTRISPWLAFVARGNAMRQEGSKRREKLFADCALWRSMGECTPWTKQTDVNNSVSKLSSMVSVLTNTLNLWHNRFILLRDCLSQGL